MPSRSIRVRSTPCHSGVTRASASITGLRLEIGKKAPENRNIGIIPSRNTSAKALSFFIEAVSAKSGDAKARPISGCTRNAPTTPAAVANRPNGVITSRKTTLIVATRNSTNPSWPKTMSPTVSGVAIIE